MNTKVYEWVVIGAGPAGIATIGNLLDTGVAAESIAWVDPQFSVGDFGTLWQEVSSNTSVSLFHAFFNACKAFDFDKAPNFTINQFDPKETCQLKYAATPLQWITKQLLQKIFSYKTIAVKIAMQDGRWLIKLKNSKNIFANNIVLAVGSEPQSLKLIEAEEIPIKIALDKNKLQLAIKGKNNIAVVGSSHSAIILIRDLLELGINNVTNFYLDPLRYAVFFEDWTLFDNTGLKGNTAQWARANLHGNLPKGLQRYLSTPDNLKQYSKNLDAVIYATGFKRRAIEIEGVKNDFDYNPHCGVIAPGLFGLGIAFPEKTIDRYGHQELSVGLWKFMTYLKKIMPLWHSYGLK